MIMITTNTELLRKPINIANTFPTVAASGNHYLVGESWSGEAIALKKVCCLYVFALTQTRASESQYISLIVKNTYQTLQKPRIAEQDTFQYIPLKILPKPVKYMQQLVDRFFHRSRVHLIFGPLAMFLETLIATSIFNHSL
jgi:hypothetical protein